MTTRDEAREAIYEAFRVGWSDETNYWFDNEIAEPEDLEEWVRLTIRHSISSQETLGKEANRKFDRAGRVLVQVFVALDKGTNRSDELSTKVRDIFEGKTISGIRFTAVTIREIGEDNQKWFNVIVEAPFNYTEIK